MKEARRHPPLQVSQAQVRPGKSWPKAYRRGPYGTYTWNELPLPCFTRPHRAALPVRGVLPFPPWCFSAKKMGLLSLTPAAPEGL